MTSEALNPQHVWLLPGWQNSDPGHWQSLWQDRYGYQRLEQHSWQHPLRGDWSIRLQETVLDAPAPVTLVAHSLGCVLVAWWAAFAGCQTKVRGACWWHPATPSRRVCAASCGLVARAAALPFPSILVGSENDPCSVARAQAMAQGWGSRFVNAGAAGHINTASGLGLGKPGMSCCFPLKKEFSNGD
jgi:predicted alpha/beta hydrolase family esterase